jgi:hypothetical protein
MRVARISAGTSSCWLPTWNDSQGSKERENPLPIFHRRFFAWGGVKSNSAGWRVIHDLKLRCSGSSPSKSCWQLWALITAVSLHDDAAIARDRLAHGSRRHAGTHPAPDRDGRASYLNRCLRSCAHWVGIARFLSFGTVAGHPAITSKQQVVVHRQTGTGADQHVHPSSLQHRQFAARRERSILEGAEVD